jgi:hypothetical protein
MEQILSVPKVAAPNRSRTPPLLDRPLRQLCPALGRGTGNGLPPPKALGLLPAERWYYLDFFSNASAR